MEKSESRTGSGKKEFSTKKVSLTKNQKENSLELHFRQDVCKRGTIERQFARGRIWGKNKQR
jgi:hypothetical protein